MCEAAAALRARTSPGSQLAGSKSRKFAIIDRELSIEAGDLTTSMTLRRKVVLPEFVDLLAALYT